MTTAVRLRRSRITAVLVAAPVLAALAACGGSTGTGTGTAATTGTGAPAVTTSGAASPTSDADASIAAVIGGWAAQYGTARNSVLTSLDALGSAGSAAEVEAAAGEALAAVEEAGTLAECPDPDTERAYRAALADLSAQLEQVRGSGDTAAAQALAASGSQAFDATEDALSAAYG
jgi:hypothetical protein